MARRLGAVGAFCTRPTEWFVQCFIQRFISTSLAANTHEQFGANLGLTQSCKLLGRCKVKPTRDKLTGAVLRPGDLAMWLLTAIVAVGWPGRLVSQEVNGAFPETTQRDDTKQQDDTAERNDTKQQDDTAQRDDTAGQDDTAQRDDAPQWDVVELLELPPVRDVWSPPQMRLVRGEIQRFESEQLQLLDSQGDLLTLPSKYVLRVYPRWRTAQAALAHQLFEAGEFQQMVKAVPTALESNLVQWQQRILIAELVQGVEALGKIQAAGAYFLSLSASQPPPLLYSAMPLCWTSREPDQALRDAARQWLQKPDDEAAWLLGASWLLFTEHQPAAQAAIVKLQATSNPVIAQLAVAQGWRLTPPPQTMAELSRWLEFRDKLLPPLQLGPTEFIADRLQRIGELDLAIGEWSRIGSQYGEQAVRARAALGNAAAQLKRLGRDDDAQRFETWMNELEAARAGAK